MKGGISGKEFLQDSTFNSMYSNTSLPPWLNTNQPYRYPPGPKPKTKLKPSAPRHLFMWALRYKNFI